jgi:GTPase SAR1 family protein
VALGEHAILLAGASGSGKSTLTLALVRAGFDLLGDDMTFLSSTDGHLRIHSFPDEIDVSPASAQWFPELEDLRAAPADGWPKHRFRLEERYEAPVRMGALPAVIVFPSFRTTGQARSSRSRARPRPYASSPTCF